MFTWACVLTQTEDFPYELANIVVSTVLAVTKSMMGIWIKNMCLKIAWLPMRHVSTVLTIYSRDYLLYTSHWKSLKFMFVHCWWFSSLILTINFHVKVYIQYIVCKHECMHACMCVCGGDYPYWHILSTCTIIYNFQPGLRMGKYIKAKHINSTVHNSWINRIRIQSNGVNVWMTSWL